MDNVLLTFCSAPLPFTVTFFAGGALLHYDYKRNTGVNSFSTNTYCACPQGKTFQSHANLMTAPWAKFSCFPLQKRWPFGAHRRNNETILTIVGLFGLWEIKLKNHSKEHASLWHCLVYTQLYSELRPLTLFPRRLRDTTSREVL